MSIDMEKFSIEDKNGNDVTESFSKAFIYAIRNFWFTVDTGNLTGFHPIVNQYKFNMVLHNRKPLEVEKIIFHDDVEKLFEFEDSFKTLEKLGYKVIPFIRIREKDESPNIHVVIRKYDHPTTHPDLTSLVAEASTPEELKVLVNCLANNS